MRIFRNRKEGDDRPQAAVKQPLQGPMFWPYYGETVLPTVTNDNVLGIPALWRGLNMIGNALGTVSPVQVFEGDEKIETPLVLAQPSPDIGCFDFFHAAVIQLLVNGQCIFLPLDYVDGFPTQLLPVPDYACHVRYDDAGKVVYDIGGETLTADKVIHIRNFTRPGSPNGVGIVAAFRKSIGGQLVGQDTSSNAAIPSGIIKIDVPEITEEQANTTKADWLERFGAAASGRTPAVLPNTMSFEPISFSAEDSQWIESRQLGIAEAAFILNLDPSDLGATVGGQNQTYANIQQRAVERITQTYGPIARRFEEALGTLLPEGQRCRFNWERLLRTDSNSRAAFLTEMLANGVYNLAYAQELENIPLEFRGVAA